MKQELSPIANPALCPTLADDECGPEMKKLTDLQRRFVTALMMLGCGKGVRTQAAIVASNNTWTEDSCAVYASRAMRNPKILAALREETDRALQGDGYIGAAVLKEIALDPLHKDRYKAADALLNRAGHLVETVNRVVHENDPETTKQLLAEIRALASDPDVQRVLKQTGHVIDVEFTEVPKVENGNEGLEDLL